MPLTLKVTPWPGSTLPTEAALRQLIQAQGYTFYAWSNGPHDRYAAHRHDFDKVLFCASGSITFRLEELDQAVELHPGDRLDLPAGTLHAAEVGAQGVTCFEAHL